MLDFLAYYKDQRHRSPKGGSFGFAYAPEAFSVELQLHCFSIMRVRRSQVYPVFNERGLARLTFA